MGRSCSSAKSVVSSNVSCELGSGWGPETLAEGIHGRAGVVTGVAEVVGISAEERELEEEKGYAFVSRGRPSGYSRPAFSVCAHCLQHLLRLHTCLAF